MSAATRQASETQRDYSWRPQFSGHSGMARFALATLNARSSGARGLIKKAFQHLHHDALFGVRQAA
jgi:hypothetical protein